MTDTDGSRGLRTTQTSFDVLTAVRNREGARLMEVADALDLAKSTAYKHLETLERNGFLRKRGETYYLGTKFLQYGESVRLRWPGFDRITDAVSELTERTGEEIDFVVEDRGQVVTIEESYHPSVKYNDHHGTAEPDTYRARIGDNYHMHTTAAGLAILAEYDPTRVHEIVDRRGLPARTRHTITSRPELFDTLESVAERGYSINDEGYTDGMRSIGKALHAPDGSVLGAFSVAGPSYRIDGAVLEDELPSVLREVVAAAERDLRDEWEANPERAVR